MARCSVGGEIMSSRDEMLVAASLVIMCSTLTVMFILQVYALTTIIRLLEAM